jgi:hypothetical protein
MAEELRRLTDRRQPSISKRGHDLARHCRIDGRSRIDPVHEPQRNTTA